MATREPRRGRGRPTKLTAETTTRYCEGLRLGLTRELAAAYAGVGQSTVHEWLARGDPSHEEHAPRFAAFLEAVEDADARAAAALTGRVLQAAKKDWKAGAWILERRYGYTRERASATASVQVQVQATAQAAALEGAPTVPADVVDAEALEWTPRAVAERRVRRLSRQLAAAEAAASHQAVAALGRQLDEAQRELLVLHQGGEITPETMDEELYLAELERAAVDMPEDHIRVFADEWLRRHNLIAVSRGRERDEGGGRLLATRED